LDRRANRPRLHDMADLVFILVTLAVFALFAMIAKGVERL
jgi:hypothetical protein